MPYILGPLSHCNFYYQAFRYAVHNKTISHHLQQIHIHIKFYIHIHHIYVHKQIQLREKISFQ